MKFGPTASNRSSPVCPDHAVKLATTSSLDKRGRLVWLDSKFIGVFPWGVSCPQHPGPLARSRSGHLILALAEGGLAEGLELREEKEQDKKKISWVRNEAWRGPWRRNRVKGQEGTPSTRSRSLPPSPRRWGKALLGDSCQASALGTRNCLGFHFPAGQVDAKPSAAWTTRSVGLPLLWKLSIPWNQELMLSCHYFALCCTCMSSS